MSKSAAERALSDLARGFVILVISAFAGLLLALSYALTVEVERPADFAGWRENQSIGALFLLMAALGAALLLLVISVTGSRRTIVMGVAICISLFVVAGFRACALAPMLTCAGHDTLSRQSDGTYECINR